MSNLIHLNKGFLVEEENVLVKVATYLYCESACNDWDINWYAETDEIIKRFGLPSDFFNEERTTKICNIVMKEFGKQVMSCYFEGEYDEQGNYIGTFYLNIRSPYIPRWTDEDSLIGESQDKTN